MASSGGSSPERAIHENEINHEPRGQPPRDLDGDGLEEGGGVLENGAREFRLDGDGLEEGGAVLENEAREFRLDGDGLEAGGGVLENGAREFRLDGDGLEEGGAPGDARPATSW